MNKQRTEKRILGDLGEDIACHFLKRKGFRVIERNYLKKFGELDIIAEIDEMLHFIEVKSVSREIGENDSRETSQYRPEDNVHRAKLERVTKTIEIYLTEKSISHETEWQIDVITVEIDKKQLISRVFMLENIIIE